MSVRGRLVRARPVRFFQRMARLGAPVGASRSSAGRRTRDGSGVSSPRPLRSASMRRAVFSAASAATSSNDNAELTTHT